MRTAGRRGVDVHHVGSNVATDLKGKRLVFVDAASLSCCGFRLGYRAISNLEKTMPQVDQIKASYPGAL
jgi:hypothetical protein